MTYCLSDRAADDLDAVYDQGLRSFGYIKARSYLDDLEDVIGLLVDNPRMGRQRPELKQPIRTFPVGSHIVVYRIEPDDSIFVIRIRHHREDWYADPAGDRP